MRGIRIILFFLAGWLPAVSQTDSALVRKAKTRALFRLGKNAMKQGDPKSAITFLEAYQKRPVKKKKPEAAYLLGKAYMEVRDYEKSQRTLKRAYDLVKSTGKSRVAKSEALYYHALMQKSNSLYDSARTNFVQFKKEYKGKNTFLKKQATKEITFCDSIGKILNDRKKITIHHLDTTVNKVNTEAAPVEVDDFTMVFTSLRTEKLEVVSEIDTGITAKRKLYYATRKKGKWKFMGEFGNALNDPGSNTGNACFNRDRSRMYFTRCKPNYKGEMICAIYVTEKKGDEWSEPEKLPKTINNPRYTSTMPSVTTDPVKGNEVLYFVSNNSAGKGGMDIWYSVYDKKKGIYKAAKNAGNKINTIQNEISPFFDTETQSLYFSSDGLGGLGGYDVYKATGDGKRWTSVDNIGLPINSGADEIYYTISPNRQEGFFVSNRKGGNALKNATCCDDIYSYFNNDYKKINLKGNIGDLLDPFDPVAGATIEVFLKDHEGKEKFLVKTAVTDNKGNYSVPLEPDQDYYIVAKKGDFLGTSGELSTKGIVDDKDLKLNLALTKKPKGSIQIPNLQYEFDRSGIMESSKTTLDTTILELMQLNPEVIIEIESHTDSKGNDKYNLKLSQKRAESVVNYLVSKGINPKRLRAKGFGESKPLAPNENPDGSDNPEGRARNRRTSFRIIGVVDAEIINEGGTE